MRCFIGFVSILLICLPSFAWGPRGHHTICDAATFVVQDKGLHTFLTGRPQIMGYLCNIPDTYWRTLPIVQTSLGDPTHFIDLEITGLKISEVPTDFLQVTKTYQGKENRFNGGTKIKDMASEFGSLWWRADQFVRRAISAGEMIKSLAPPKTGAEQQDMNLAYNKEVYDFILNIGLLGHFVGDASMPFHTTSDYDGYAANHGGIHLYYEIDAVNAQDVDLIVEVVNAAKKLREAKFSKKNHFPDFLSALTTIEKMRGLSQLSVEDIAKILKIDPVTKPSHVEELKGKTIRSAAERKSIESVSMKYKPLLVAEMARSAALLSLLWEDIYEKIGKPNLSSYLAYQFPFQPEFVPPDYLSPAEKKPSL